MGSTSGWQRTKIERIEVSPIGQITVLQTMGIGGRSQAHAIDGDQEMKPGQGVAVVIKEVAGRHSCTWFLSPCRTVQLCHHREHQRMAWDVALREVIQQPVPEQGTKHRIVIFTTEVIAGIGLKGGKGVVKRLGPDTGRELKGKRRHHIIGIEGQPRLETRGDALDAVLLDRCLRRKECEPLAQRYQPPWGFSLMAWASSKSFV